MKIKHKDGEWENGASEGGFVVSWTESHEVSSSCVVDKLEKDTDA